MLGAIADTLDVQGIWRDTADVYLRVLAMHQSESMPTNPQIIEQQLDGIVSAMQRLGCLFPIAGEFIFPLLVARPS